MSKGNLFVISGASGVGKSTVLKKVMAARDDLRFSVSATTRSPRPGEQDGVNYYFVSRERFHEMVENGEMLEHAEFVGNCYGTPKAPVLEKLKAGITVILDIEVQGAMQVMKAMPEAVTVFFMPPSLEVLEQRLRSRGTESEEVISQRLETAKTELQYAERYDYQVINDVAERAACELSDIIENGKK